MSEWKEVRLGDFIKIQNGYAFKSKEFVKEGIPVIKIKNLVNNRIDLKDVNYVNKNLLNNLENYIIKKNDILISMTGSNVNQKNSMVGKVSYVNIDIVCLLNQRVGKIILTNNQIDLKYIFYFLSQEKTQYYLASNASGSANQANINPDLIKNLYIPYKDYEISKKIADILSVIDEKIETLQNINSTLEEMAKAIFKSWFVDFDITKAKASGKSDDEIAKEFGISKEIIQLFPSEFETSEIGEIPKGWEIRKINEISNIGIGKTPPRKEKECFTINKNDIKWVSIKDMGNSNMYIFNTNEYLTKEAIKKYNIRIVPKNSVLLSFKLTLGRVSITSEEMVTNEAIAHFVIDNNSIISTEYIYLYLKTFNFDKLGNTSSIARAVNSKVVKNIPILISDNIIIKTFNKIINPIFQNIENNTQQIQTLQKTRDTLLPKLINGEIEVDELDIRGIE